ncbi:MAG: hypothetical protein ACREVQ_11125 [Burkholderiales bacterium]
MLTIAIASLGLSIATPCIGRTFTIVDTTTGKPISGAELRLIARGTFPIAIGHPGEFTLAEWKLKSDVNGEATLSSVWADSAWVFSFGKPGYHHTDTVLEYTYRRTDQTNPDMLFLTPLADVAFETVTYLYHLSAIAVDTNTGLAGMHPLFSVTVLYPQAKRSARPGRELDALRQFCRFAPAMAVERAAGWPHLGTLPEIRTSAQALIDDCSRAP